MHMNKIFYITLLFITMSFAISCSNIEPTVEEAFLSSVAGKSAEFDYNSITDDKYNDELGYEDNSGYENYKINLKFSNTGKKLTLEIRYILFNTFYIPLYSYDLEYVRMHADSQSIYTLELVRILVDDYGNYSVENTGEYSFIGVESLGGGDCYFHLNREFIEGKAIEEDEVYSGDLLSVQFTLN